MHRAPAKHLALLILLLAQPGCSSDSSSSDGGADASGRLDSAVADADSDAAPLPDVGLADVGGADVARDAGVDATLDVGVDATLDVGVDAAALADGTADVGALDGGGSCGPTIEALLSSDRVLVLAGTDTVTFPAGPCVLSRVCVSDSAAIFVDGTAQLEITGDDPSVLMGLGVGSIDTNVGRLEVSFSGTADSYFRIENQNAPFELDLDAPTHSVTILITGTAGLSVSGVVNSVTYGGDPTGFPACP